jgi:hypothetical protein
LDLRVAALAVQPRRHVTLVEAGLLVNRGEQTGVTGGQRSVEGRADKC